MSSEETNFDLLPEETDDSLLLVKTDQPEETDGGLLLKETYGELSIEKTETD